MEAYRLYRTVPAMVAFVDRLTNWYIRRSRRRFWKSADDADKAAAYATLYEVLVTFARTLAPVLPFVTEAMYQNLVRTFDPQAVESIHLADMPQADESRRAPDLERCMALASRAVVLGRSLRNKHNLKVRQPLRRLFLLPPDAAGRQDLASVIDLVADELNIKEVVVVEDETEFSQVSFKPNFRTCGPRFGKRMKEVAARVAALTPEEYRSLQAGGTLEVAGDQLRLADIEVQRQEREGLVVAIEGNLGIGLDLHLDEELVQEGTAREFVNRVQNMRKEAGLEVADRIRLGVQGEPGLLAAVARHRDVIAAETLAVEIQVGDLPDAGLLAQEWQVNGHTGTIRIAHA
jgi:isoleucyl-tRNA synthetase